MIMSYEDVQMLTLNKPILNSVDQKNQPTSEIGAVQGARGKKQ